MKIGDNVKTNLNHRIAYQGEIIDSREVDSDFCFGDEPEKEIEFLVKTSTKNVWINQADLDLI
jgi:hypothetical protein